MDRETETQKVLHKGGCHCKRVRWQVKAPAEVLCWECNCSICRMRQNLHFIVPSTDFELEEGSQQWLTEYTFGTHQAKHLFCKMCGILSYYAPRSNPDGIAVTVHCIDPGSVKSIEVKKFDGQNWESSFIASSISACSEP
ncbi:unnamed protein product [Calypogeia fissa]